MRYRAKKLKNTPNLGVMHPTPPLPETEKHEEIQESSYASMHTHVLGS